MRILYLLPSLRPSSALRQVGMLADGLRYLGDEAEVLAWDHGSPEDDSPELDSLPVTICPRPRACDLRPAWSLQRALQVRPPEAIHLFRPWELPPSAWLVLWSQRIPCVATGSWPDHQLTTWQKTSLRRIDHWLLPANDVGLRRRLGIHDNHWSFQTPAVTPITASSNLPTALLQELGLPADARFVLTVSNLVARKGIKEAIWILDIMRYLFPSLHLVVIGTGPARPRLERFATDLQLRPYVHFLGQRADVAQWMAAADVFWEPSLADDVSQAMLEAMALGRPVVATRQPGTLALVGHNHGGMLVPPCDKPAFARQTKLLLEDADLRERLGAQGQALAGQYTPDRLVHACSEKYKELLSRRGYVPSATVAA